MTILWLDFETDGLDIADCTVLEVGCVLTHDDLEKPEIADLSVTAHFPLEGLEAMDPFVQEMHRKSGLWDDCLNSTVTPETIPFLISSFLDENKIKHKIPVGGSGVGHYDRAIIRERAKHYLGWQSLNKRLAYWVYDVGVMRRTLWRVRPDLVRPKPDPNSDKPHRGLADVREHIHEQMIYDILLRTIRN